MRTIDEIDKKIINILEQEGRTAIKDIAKEVFLSSPAVSTRIENLERDGVIMGYHAKINPSYLNYHVKAFINLEVDPKDKDVFYPYVESIPNVIEVNCVTGDYSMMLETLFESTNELDTFINELQRFGRTKTQIVFSTPVEQRPAPIK